MPFSQGQINFAIFFIIVFSGVLIWAYRKDIKRQPKYAKGSLFILIAIILMFILFRALNIVIS